MHRHETTERQSATSRALTIGLALVLALAMFEAVAPTSAYAAVLVVDDDGVGVDAVDCAQGAATHNTIQAAITAAAPGDTVFVCPGTYNEQVVIDKSLTLSGDPGDAAAGPGANAPVLDGNAVIGSAITIQGGVSDVVIEGFEIRNYAPQAGTGGIGSGVLAWNATPINDVTVRDNRFLDLGWSAVLVGNEGQASHSGWSVTRNTAERVAWYVFELTNTINSTVTSNVVTGGTAHGETTDDAILIQAQVHVGAGITVSDVTVEGNQIGGTVERAGIELLAWDSTNTWLAKLADISVLNNDVSNAERGVFLYAVGTNASIDPAAVTGNTINNNTTGIRAASWAGGTFGAVTINSNVITDNTAGVNNTAPQTIDATCNWWGAADGPSGVGPGTGDSVSAGATFDPWFSTADVSGPCAAEELGDGGNYSTGDPATPDDPLQVSLTTPNGGAVTVVANPAGPDPGGYVLFGQQFTITAPAATVGDPLVIVFLIDPSLLPPGENIWDVVVFRNGVAVPACKGAPDAIPDPCVSSRVVTGDGDFEITVLTSLASTWDFGTRIVHGGGGGGGGGGVSYYCAGIPATIVGTDAGETIPGTAGDDVIVGLGGDDVISGRGGDDVICGGLGDDTINGGGGNDRLFGEQGNDLIRGGLGRDRAHGGDDADELWGGKGNDRLLGDGGDDFLYGNRGRRDHLDGGAGDDHLDGGPGNADFGVNGPTFVNIELM